MASVGVPGSGAFLLLPSPGLVKEEVSEREMMDSEPRWSGSASPRPCSPGVAPAMTPDRSRDADILGTLLGWRRSASSRPGSARPKTPVAPSSRRRSKFAPLPPPPPLPPIFRAPLVPSFSSSPSSSSSPPHPRPCPPDSAPVHLGPRPGGALPSGLARAPVAQRARAALTPTPTLASFGFYCSSRSSSPHRPAKAPGRCSSCPRLFSPSSAPLPPRRQCSLPRLGGSWVAAVHGVASNDSIRTAIPPPPFGLPPPPPRFDSGVAFDLFTRPLPPLIEAAFVLWADDDRSQRAVRPASVAPPLPLLSASPPASLAPHAPLASSPRLSLIPNPSSTSIPSRVSSQNSSGHSHSSSNRRWSRASKPSSASLPPHRHDSLSSSTPNLAPSPPYALLTPPPAHVPRPPSVHSQDKSPAPLPEAKVLMAATIERWIAELTTRIDPAGLSEFFLTYRTVMTPLELFKLLASRLEWTILFNCAAYPFPPPPALLAPTCVLPRITIDGRAIWIDPAQDAERRIAKVRTFVTFRHWLVHHFEDDFLPSPELQAELLSWLHALNRKLAAVRHHLGVLNYPQPPHRVGGQVGLTILDNLLRIFNDSRQNVAEALHAYCPRGTHAHSTSSPQSDSHSHPRGHGAEPCEAAEQTISSRHPPRPWSGQFLNMTKTSLQTEDSSDQQFTQAHPQTLLPPSDTSSAQPTHLDQASPSPDHQPPLTVSTVLGSPGHGHSASYSSPGDSTQSPHANLLLSLEDCFRLPTRRAVGGGHQKGTSLTDHHPHPMLSSPTLGSDHHLSTSLPRARCLQNHPSLPPLPSGSPKPGQLISTTSSSPHGIRHLGHVAGPSFPQPHNPIHRYITSTMGTIGRFKRMIHNRSGTPQSLHPGLSVPLSSSASSSSSTSSSISNHLARALVHGGSDHNQVGDLLCVKEGLERYLHFFELESSPRSTYRSEEPQDDKHHDHHRSCSPPDASLEVSSIKKTTTSNRSSLSIQLQETGQALTSQINPSSSAVPDEPLISSPARSDLPVVHLDVEEEYASLTSLSSSASDMTCSAIQSVTSEADSFDLDPAFRTSFLRSNKLGATATPKGEPVVLVHDDSNAPAIAGTELDGFGSVDEVLVDALHPITTLNEAHELPHRHQQQQQHHHQRSLHESLSTETIKSELNPSIITHQNPVRGPGSVSLFRKSMKPPPGTINKDLGHKKLAEAPHLPTPPISPKEPLLEGRPRREELDGPDERKDISGQVQLGSIRQPCITKPTECLSIGNPVVRPAGSVQLDDLDLSESDEEWPAMRKLRRLPGAIDLKQALGFNRKSFFNLNKPGFSKSKNPHLLGEGEVQRFSSETASSVGTRRVPSIAASMFRRSKLSSPALTPQDASSPGAVPGEAPATTPNGSEEPGTDAGGVAVVANFVADGLESDDDEPGDVEAALRRLEGVIDADREKEKARKVELQMMKSVQVSRRVRSSSLPTSSSLSSSSVTSLSELDENVDDGRCERDGESDEVDGKHGGGSNSSRGPPTTDREQATQPQRGGGEALQGDRALTPGKQRTLPFYQGTLVEAVGHDEDGNVVPDSRPQSTLPGSADAAGDTPKPRIRFFHPSGTGSPQIDSESTPNSVSGFRNVLKPSGRRRPKAQPQAKGTTTERTHTIARKSSLHMLLSSDSVTTPTKKPSAGRRKSLGGLRKPESRKVTSQETGSRLHPSSAAVTPISVLALPPVHRSFLLSCRTQILAQQFCLIERDLLRNVTWQELLLSRWQPGSSLPNNSKKGTGHPARPVEVNCWETFMKERAKEKMKLKEQQSSGVGESGGANWTEIRALITRFNLTCNWVASEIVMTVNLDERVMLLGKFIRLAFKCYRQNNFQTLTQIIHGLQTPYVERLEKTWSKLGMWEKRMFRDLKAFTWHGSNFKSMRNMQDCLAQQMRIYNPSMAASLAGRTSVAAVNSTGLVHGPEGLSSVANGGGVRSSQSYSRGPGVGPVACIPFMGLYLRDLTINDEVPTYLDPSEPSVPAKVDPSTGMVTELSSPGMFAGLEESWNLSFGDWESNPLGLVARYPLVNVHKLRTYSRVVQKVQVFQASMMKSYQFETDERWFLTCLKIKCLDSEQLRRLSSMCES